MALVGLQQVFTTHFLPSFAMLTSSFTHIKVNEICSSCSGCLDLHRIHCPASQTDVLFDSHMGCHSQGKKKRNCSCSAVYFCGMSFLTRHHQKDFCYQCSNTSHSLMKQEKIHRAVPGTRETLAFHQFQGQNFTVKLTICQVLIDKQQIGAHNTFLSCSLISERDSAV